LFTDLKLKQFKDALSQLRDMDVPQLIQDDEIDAVGLRATTLIKWHNYSHKNAPSLGSVSFAVFFDSRPYMLFTY
jgi:hypothetical protein